MGIERLPPPSEPDETSGQELAFGEEILDQVMMEFPLGENQFNRGQLHDAIYLACFDAGINSPIVFGDNRRRVVNVSMGEPITQSKLNELQQQIHAIIQRLA